MWARQLASLSSLVECSRPDRHDRQVFLNSRRKADQETSHLIIRVRKTADQVHQRSLTIDLVHLVSIVARVIFAFEGETCTRPG